MKIKKQITEAFTLTKYTVTFGKDWVNVMRPDGVHCEFYPSTDYQFLSAQYTLKGIETEINLEIPSQLNEFVDICKEILK